MLIVNIFGLALIAWIVWWFWLYRPKSTALSGNELIVVVENGVYQPAHVKLPAHQAVTLKFLRKDPSPCAEMVVIPTLQLSESLPLNQTKAIQLPAMEAGNYAFHCQMQMYRGELIVA